MTGGETREIRTAGVVWRGVHVIEVHRSRLGHLEVNHVRGVLQRSHRLLMTHVLQHDVVHLDGMIVTRREEEKSTPATQSFLPAL